MKRWPVLLLLVLGPSCGGAKVSAVEPEVAQVTPSSPDVLSLPTMDAGHTAATPTTQPAPAPDAMPPLPASPVSFVLSNAGTGDLVFAIDKGWQPVVFAYRGQPPKATSVLLFATACTESCESDPAAMCPVCSKKTDDIKEIRRQEEAETRRAIAPAGGSVTVPWDGQVFVYEKAPAAAKKKKCQCWRKVDPPGAEYTVKACGLRPSTEPGQPSRPVCAQTRVTLPLAQTPQTISLSFP
jgi:hypothetical protein